MTTTKHRILSAATLLIMIAMTAVSVWTLCVPAYAPWMWWTMMFCAIVFALSTAVFAASHDGLAFILRGDKE